MSESNGGYNLSVLSNELKDEFKHKMAASTMQKCVPACLMSLNEDQLLAREEACLRNCFIKSAQFNKHFEGELRYTLRQFNSQPDYAKYTM